MDDATVGRALRALRIRRHWRQDDLAVAAGVSQSVVSRAERGHFATIQVGTARALFAALDAGCTLAPWWRSGQLDRLLDEDHAAIVARAAALIEGDGWSVSVEVSFAVYAERGSIDILATRTADRAALVVEVKSRLMSVEELLRTLDRKVRLASGIVQDREGWRPNCVGRLVVLAEDSTNRRRVGRASVLATALPTRGPAVGEWLRRPVASASSLLFLSASPGRNGKQRVVSVHRVRRAGSCTKRVVRAAMRTESSATSPRETE
jgi:transcriptional regulator with XRE-family HTH domain